MITSFLLALLLAGPQPLSALELDRLSGGIEVLRTIDEELATIRRSESVLSNSAEMRAEEISSLRLRYPGIVIQDGASTDQILQALTEHRNFLVGPISELNKRNLAVKLTELCEAQRNLDEAVANLDKDQDYQRMPLKDRLRLRREIEDSRAEFTNSINTCP